jgi:hypothetical protein
MGKKDKLLNSIEELQENLNNTLSLMSEYVNRDGIDPSLILELEDVELIINDLTDQLDSFSNAL